MATAEGGPSGWVIDGEPVIVPSTVMSVWPFEIASASSAAVETLTFMFHTIRLLGPTSWRIVVHPKRVLTGRPLSTRRTLVERRTVFEDERRAVIHGGPVVVHGAEIVFELRS